MITGKLKLETKVEYFHYKYVIETEETCLIEFLGKMDKNRNFYAANIKEGIQNYLLLIKC